MWTEDSVDVSKMWQRMNRIWSWIISIGSVWWISTVKFVSGGRRDLSRFGITDHLGTRWDTSVNPRICVFYWSHPVQATFDYTEERSGERASTLGEKPYFDPSSKLRSEALREEGVRVWAYMGTVTIVGCLYIGYACFDFRWKGENMVPLQ